MEDKEKEVKVINLEPKKGLTEEEIKRITDLVIKNTKSF